MCIILYSLIECAGKTKLIELIENIIGEKYSFSITDVSSQLFGKHFLIYWVRFKVKIHVLIVRHLNHALQTLKEILNRKELQIQWF